MPHRSWAIRRTRRPPPAEATKAKAPSFGALCKTLLPKPSFWLLSFGAAASSVCGYGVAAWLPSFFMPLPGE